MKGLFAGQDVFDVLELVRQHEIPVVIEGYQESQAEGMVAVIEIVALAAIDLSERQVPVNGDIDPDDILPANQVVEPLCDLARQIVTLATMLSVAEGASNENPLGELAGQLRSSELMIRNKHYQSIGGLLNDGVFNAPQVRAALEAALGYNFADILAVSAAIRQRYQDVKLGLRDRLGEIFHEHGSVDNLPADAVEEGHRLLSDFMISPGRSSAFTSSDISDRSEVPLDRINMILADFSVGWSSSDAETLVWSFVQGVNPFAGVDLVCDGDGNFLMLQNGIPGDQIRRILERKIKAHPKSKLWDAYGRHRDKFAEKLAIEQVSALLGVEDAAFKQLKYLAPPKGVLDCDLSKEANNPRSYAHIVEGDALFIVDDVAVCLEVKAGSITDKAKTGNMQRMADDLRKTIVEATDQAQRLESLILKNAGLWRENGKWLDLAAVREVRTIVACLDDFGPLAIATDALVRSDLLNGITVPWIVSLHDLVVTAGILGNPAAFLLYLRRRTESQAARMFVATDELDLLMWFVHGGLYFEADPEALHERFPMSPKPTSQDRARFKQEVPTRVGTLTDELDAWMYYSDGLSSIEAPKPTRIENAHIGKLVSFLAEGRKPGWLRFGADLLNLSGQTQRSVAKTIKTVVARTGNDHDFHTSAQGFVGPWGYPVLSIGSQPQGNPMARDKLEVYIELKKYQLRADRSLGLLVAESGEIVGVSYRNGPWKPDEGMERLVAEANLISPHSIGSTLNRRKSSNAKKRRKRKKRGR